MIGQPRQRALPCVELYVLGPHSMHVAILTAPIVVENVPTGHVVHVDVELAPITLEYLPASQDVHVRFEEASTAAE